MDVHLSPPISKTTNSRRISPRHNMSSSIFSSPRQLAVRTDSVIREGNDFQAPVEDLEKAEKTKSLDESLRALTDEKYRDRDICLWQPPSLNVYPLLNDESLVEYCRLANEHFGINMEQALFILYALNYDMEAAKLKLPKHVMIPDKFTDEDQFAFRFAFNCYGKNFSKIRQMMSHKSLPALVQHYYNTKKHELFKSTIDSDRMISNESEEELSDEKDAQTKTGICDNCQSCVRKLHLINELEICTCCKRYFLVTNQHRLCRNVGRQRRRITCPPNLRKAVSEFVHYAEPAEMTNFQNADESGELQIACKIETRCEKSIRNIKMDIAKMRAEAVGAESLARAEFKCFNSYTSSTGFLQARAFLERTASLKSRITSSWEDSEKLIAFHSLILNDCDFAGTAEVLGTKTVEMVKSFYFDECKDEIDKYVQSEDDSNIKRKKVKRIDFDEEFRKLQHPPEIIDIE